MTDESSLREVLKGLCEGLEPFESGPDGDQCIWCRRNRDRKIESWQQAQDADYHDADCAFIAALAALASQPSGVSVGHSSGPQHVGGDRINKDREVHEFLHSQEAEEGFRKAMANPMEVMYPCGTVASEGSPLRDCPIHGRGCFEFRDWYIAEIEQKPHGTVVRNYRQGPRVEIAPGTSLRELLWTAWLAAKHLDAAATQPPASSRPARGTARQLAVLCKALALYQERSPEVNRLPSTLMQLVENVQKSLVGDDT